MRIVGIFHFILGGLTCLFGLFFLFYVVFGAILMAAPATGTATSGSVASFGAFMIGLGTAMVLFVGVLGGIQIYVGYSLFKGQHYYLCLVIAILELLNFPFGTVLGILTIILLNMDGSKRHFARGSKKMDW